MESTEYNKIIGDLEKLDKRSRGWELLKEAWEHLNEEDAAAIVEHFKTKLDDNPKIFDKGKVDKKWVIIFNGFFEVITEQSSDLWHKAQRLYKQVK